MRVLIADDDRLICDLMEEYVQRCGHEVVGKVTAGGLAVIRGFACSQPDLVLLDVMMPRCNGLTVAHALRSRSASVKLVLMSGMYEESHPFVQGCRVDAFIKKPLLYSDLWATLSRLDLPAVATETPAVVMLPDFAVAV